MTFPGVVTRANTATLGVDKRCAFVYLAYDFTLAFIKLQTKAPRAQESVLGGIDPMLVASIGFSNGITVTKNEGGIKG